MRDCRSSTLLVNAEVSSARSLKLTRKNSSCGFAVFVDLVGHAAAEVENDADRDGNVFGREGDDFLLDVIFKHAEVVRVEAGNQAIVRIGDGDVDKREVDVGADGPTGPEGNGGGVAGDIAGLGDKVGSGES